GSAENHTVVILRVIFDGLGGHATAAGAAGGVAVQFVAVVIGLDDGLGGDGGDMGAAMGVVEGLCFTLAEKVPVATGTLTACIGARHRKARPQGVASGNLGVSGHITRRAAEGDKVVALVPVFVRQLQAEVNLVGAGVGGDDMAIDLAVGHR